ncbi:MAG: lipopolysaccharide biosynthesis protein [Bacteroidaceae bacterium]|nr:lipopolysaccharide biosynthesis protein [Bacteroidaceae bacterium]
MAINNRRIAKNTLMLYVRMLLLMAVSLYTSRVVLTTLGIDDYGIYNLIAGFITLFSFISNALVGAMQRFFNVALGHNNHGEYQRIYAMGYNIFAIFSLFLLVVGETVGVWFVGSELNIPFGRETATMWVYQISLLTLIVNLFRTPDNASIIANERMQFYAYISILEAVIKLAIVFLLNLMDFDKLILYVVLYLLATAFTNLVFRLYCARKIADCRYRLLWDTPLFKRMVAFSGWHMLTGGSRVIKTQGESLLLNHFFTVAVNAAFGVAAQVYNAVNLFLTNFQTAFNPQLVQSYAAGDMDAHRALAIRSARLSYFLLLMIAVPIAFNLDGLLQLWLTEVPQYTREFCVFLLLAYLVDAIGAPLSVSVNATGHIRGMQIGISVILMSGLFASFFFLHQGAVAYIVAIVTFFVHVGFWICYMYFARKHSGFSLRQYARKVVIPCMLVGVISAVVPYSMLSLKVTGWTVLLICLANLLWTIIIIYVVGMQREERSFAKSAISNVLKRII